MINMSECFQMIGVNGCMDVATSLIMQGTDENISIPIYGPFYMSILSGESTNFLSSSIPEFNALRKLAVNCGAVACTINILEVSLLTLLGSVLIYTPDTGMNVFIKNNIPELVDLSEDLIKQVVNLTPFATDFINFPTIDIASKAIDWLINILIERLDNDLIGNGINVRKWEELPDYYTYVVNTGEMNEMARMRATTGAAIL